MTLLDLLAAPANAVKGWGLERPLVLTRLRPIFYTDPVGAAIRAMGLG